MQFSTVIMQRALLLPREVENLLKGTQPVGFVLQSLLSEMLSQATLPHSTNIGLGVHL